MTNSHNQLEGPSAYKNWKKALGREPLKCTYEYPLFTDAHITGQIEADYGPYQLLNVRIQDTRTDFPAIILRVDEHIDYVDEASKKKFKRDNKHYHGGDLCDEIAALLSLTLGIRLKAGTATRRFEPDGNPKGQPIAFGVGNNTIILKSSNWLHVLPKVLGTHNLAPNKLITGLPELSTGDASALVRAARLYQDALWIAESEAALSWLMLVSAVETAAGHWRTVKKTPSDRVRDSKPALAAMLLEVGGKEHLEKVSKEIADSMGATKKFIDFVLTFLPEPPTERPHENLQVSWEREDMKKMMSVIYNWRSKALHGGTPFPYPMCYPPGNLFEEKPIGLAVSAKGGVWKATDTPMLLHTFEYIVRHALLKWWKSMFTGS